MIKEKPEIMGPIHRVRRSEDDTEGLGVGLHVENGNIILDLNKPIQYLGLSTIEAKAFVVGMVEAIFHAESDAVVEKKNLN